MIGPGVNDSPHDAFWRLMRKITAGAVERRASDGVTGSRA